jgi:hypothetical protein
MSESEKLFHKIDKAFPHGPPPKEEDIAPHRCLVCDQLRKTFAKYDASTLPDEVVDANFSRLPLLSPGATRAYLGSYLKRAVALADFEHLVCQFLLYGFSPKIQYWEEYFPNYSLFDDNQMQVLVEFFDLARGFKGAEDHARDFKRLDAFMGALVAQPRPSSKKGARPKRKR